MDSRTLIALALLLQREEPRPSPMEILLPGLMMLAGTQPDCNSQKSFPTNDFQTTSRHTGDPGIAMSNALLDALGQLKTLVNRAVNVMRHAPSAKRRDLYQALLNMGTSAAQFTGLPGNEIADSVNQIVTAIESEIATETRGANESEANAGHRKAREAREAVGALVAVARYVASGTDSGEAGILYDDLRSLIRQHVHGDLAKSVIRGLRQAFVAEGHGGVIPENDDPTPTSVVEPESGNPAPGNDPTPPAPPSDGPPGF